MMSSEQRQLEAPFPFSSHQVRVSSKSKDGKRIQWVVYVDREEVISRLNGVLGLSGWSSRVVSEMQGFTPEGKHYALCTIEIRIGEVVRQDSGEGSGSSDLGNNVKAAVTDALKRAASQFGVGLYLWSSPQIWTDGEDQKGALGQVERWLQKFPIMILDRSEPSPTETGEMTEALNPLAAGRRAGDAKQKWDVDQVIARVGFMYKDPAHAKNSLTKLVREGILTPEFTNITAAARVFLYRCEKGYRLDEGRVASILEDAIETKLGSRPMSVWLKDRSLEEAWGAVQKWLGSHANVPLESSEDVAEAEMDIPF